jgi:hypothetical protein
MLLINDHSLVGAAIRPNSRKLHSCSFLQRLRSLRLDDGSPCNGGSILGIVASVANERNA